MYGMAKVDNINFDCSAVAEELHACVCIVMAEGRGRGKLKETPSCKNAEEKIENSDSYYLTEAYQQLVRLLITEQFRAVDTAPDQQLGTAFEEAPNFLDHFDIKSEHGKDSSREIRPAITKNNPQHCKNKDEVDENEKSENAFAAESYLSEAHQQFSSTHQEGRLLITGQFKVMDHHDTPEHYEFEELTGKQLDSTFEELNSLGLFYIEAGPAVLHI